MRIMRPALTVAFAVLAFSAMAASSASANHVTFLTGSNKNLSFTGTSGLSVLAAVNAGITGTIECEKDASSGEILNNTSLADKVEVEFSGKCEQLINGGKSTCNEPIKIKLALGELGLLNKTNKKVALLLAPESGTEFVTVTCGGNPTKVKGAIVGEFPEKVGTTNQYDKFLNTLTLEFKASGVKQECQEFELQANNNVMMGVHLSVEGFFGGEASEKATETLKADGSGTAELMLV